MQVTQRICTGKCRRLLDVTKDNFWKKAERKDGFVTKCKDCMREAYQKHNNSYIKRRKKHKVINDDTVCAYYDDYIYC